MEGRGEEAGERWKVKRKYFLLSFLGLVRLKVSVTMKSQIVTQIPQKWDRVDSFQCLIFFSVLIHPHEKFGRKTKQEENLFTELKIAELKFPFYK